MSGLESMIACPLCGTRYRTADGQVCRSGCPLAPGCRLLRCPRCSYEIPPPTRLTRALGRWLGRAP